MMVEKIKSMLCELKAQAWEISDVRTSGREFYFIRHRLDQCRAKDVRHVRVWVYMPAGEGMIGSASGEVYVTATDGEIRETLSALCRQAALAPNREWKLNPKRVEHEIKRSFEAVDPDALGRQFIRVFDSLPETDTEDLNSYEIFADAVTRRFVNSEGIDFTETYPQSRVEAVINARDGKKEIELYRYYESGGCGEAELSRDLTKVMEFGRDRLRAVPTPKLNKIDVVFSTADAKEIYNYFIDRLDPAMIVRRLSPWQKGKPIFENITGDAVTLRAIKTLPGSSECRLFDREGAPVRDELMMEKGVPRCFLGGRMFSCYMGLQNTFEPGNFEVTGGTLTATGIRSGTYLETVEFSDFQVNSLSGDILGEIRLAYLHEGDKTIPVTGGSISGNMNDLVPGMRMSRELARFDNMLIPAATRLPGVTVTGAEH